MPQFVDYFVVCGVESEELEKDATSALSSHLAPLNRRYTPKVISHFPEKVSWNHFDESAVKTLCMPEGLLFKKNLKDPRKSTHSFLITRENGTHAYGSVVIFYEQVQSTRVLNTLEALQARYQETRRGGLNSDHDLSFNRTEDSLFATKCICFITSKPVFGPCQAYLEQLYAIAAGEKSAKLPLESYIYNILYEVPFPAPGKCIRFLGPLGRISWRCPSQSELPLCDFSFREFFELLAVRSILKVVTCLLLEHQILIKASDYDQLMLCAYCSTALIFPFSWHHVFVPILPASQRGFLDAPVPYIMGLKIDRSKYSNVPNEFSLCTVDLDEGTVECPDELPILPDMDRLILQVSEKVQEHSVNCPDVSEVPTSPDTIRKPSVIEAIRFVKDQLNTPASHDADVITDLTLNNPHIPNLINIATRAGIETPITGVTEMDEGALDLDEYTDGDGDFSPDKRETRFATAIRDVFATYFVEHFANYENFIIMPSQTYDQWQRNREQFQNFDKTAFLSDQPSNHWEFYAAFLESSMFTALIDQKIVMFFEPNRSGQNLQLFDSRVEAYRDKTGLAKPPTTPGSGRESYSSDNGDSNLDDSNEVIAETAPTPKPPLKEVVMTEKTKVLGTRVFSQLDAVILQVNRPDEGSESKESASEGVATRRFITRPGSGKVLDISRSPLSLRRHRHPGGSPASGFSSHSHAKFVNQLWRESRLRVKHMLGSTGEGQNYVEENTHIAYLCDLLERIWGHGLKKRESKSPLWAHLMAYANIMGQEELPPAAPSPPQLTSSMSSLSMLSTGTDESPRSQNLKAQFRRRKFRSPQLRSRVETILQPPPSSLLSDLGIVHVMRELKTDVGHARAWVRLSLEKKSLSRHLSKLLANEELCNHRYREYAFLRTEEEREQFLYHLLTLTARDFNCFTTGFVNATMTYRILVVGEGKHFGLSTASLYVNVGGEYRETGVTEIPRGEYQTDITHRNLGPLTTLRIGHDNSGITPSLLVEMVLVHNVTTGQTYRFNCGRWFARGGDDGSVERFLIAEKVPQTISKSCSISALDVDSVLPSPGSRRKSPKKESEECPGVADINLRLKSAVEKIRTVSMGNNKDTMRQEMLQEIHGPDGFVKCLEQVFHYGFRSSRKFQKRLYIWDLLERVHEHLSTEPTLADSGAEETEDHALQMFLNAVARINTNNTSIGKDEKATIFFCIGLRDHYLTSWIDLIARCPVSQGLYETESFLHNTELLQVLLDTLTLTHPLVIRLEALLTQGL